MDAPFTQEDFSEKPSVEKEHQYDQYTEPLEQGDHQVDLEDQEGNEFYDDEED